MSSQALTAPEPETKGPYQSGIADPIWPPEPPPGVDAAVYKEYYAGQVERQRFLHAVFADLRAGSTGELIAALKNLTYLASTRWNASRRRCGRSIHRRSTGKFR